MTNVLLTLNKNKSTSNCTPYGLALRESISSVIEKHQPNSLSHSLSSLLIQSMNFNPDKLSTIASFYTKVKYCIYNIEALEFGEEAYSDDSTKADLDTFFALKEFLAYLKSINCPYENIKMVLDILIAYNNYPARARVIEKELKLS